MLKFMSIMTSPLFYNMILYSVQLSKEVSIPSRFINSVARVAPRPIGA